MLKYEIVGDGQPCAYDSRMPGDGQKVWEKWRATSTCAVAAFALEPMVQVEAMLAYQAFRYGADLHNNTRSRLPG